MMKHKVVWCLTIAAVAAVSTIIVRPVLRTWWHNQQHPGIHVYKLGQGEPVLLLHGLTGTHRYWQPVFEALKEEYTLVAPDLPGFGHSVWPDEGYGINEAIAALEPVFPSGRFALIGHSMGSQIAIEIAKRYPDRVKSLVLLAPPSFRDRADLKKVLADESMVESIMAMDKVWAPLICHLHEVMGDLTYYFYRPFVQPDLPDFLVRDAIKHTWNSYDGSVRNIVLQVYSADEIAVLSVPTTILVGADDLYSRNDLLTSRYQNVQVLPGGHNFLWVSPGPTVRAIREALTKQNGVDSD